ncbi:MAG: glucose-6-phosphate isomerase [Chloroflexi bacterium]|nr:glucose-6-phosphate isomerase [Chloroflexota bacterium]
MNDTAFYQEHLSADLGAAQAGVDAALTEMAAAHIVRRLWHKDYTIWRPQPTEISNRLGWLDMPDLLPTQFDDIRALVADVQQAGYTHVLLLGMGGSSLAPEVFAKTFGLHSPQPPTGFALDLAVLDSTHPDAVQAQADRLHPARTLFIVATKSGGTVETLSFFKYFYNWVADALGRENAGQHFVAITDPGSKLVAVAQQYDFRDTFLNNPHIGGRYSALSYFGMVPAALAGVDIDTLVQRAQAAARACRAATANPGAILGAILGELAKAGRDKATFVLPPELASFGDWVEQLIAESTGKDGTGILPVVGESLAAPAEYGDDRLFIVLNWVDDTRFDAALTALAAAGHPVVRLQLRDRIDLGAQFFIWEIAIAIAGYRLGIQPFDQPNVESAKVQARKMTAAYFETGKLPPARPAFTADEVTVYGDWPATRRPLRTPGDVLLDFLQQAQPHDYITQQAYIQPTPAADAAIAHLRSVLRHHTKLATTAGYGPHFLHSTGQLHKGDGGHGLFLQFTSEPQVDLPIPDEAGSPTSSMSFGVLIQSQVLGDFQALVDVHRRVIRFHLGADPVAALQHLAMALTNSQA